MASSAKLDPHRLWIDALLEADRPVHKRQRHTARRIHERLVGERGFTGGYSVVRDCAAKTVLRSQEMFVPPSHRPGQ